jgi:peptidoglycan hydrolase CwlO-like protein
MSDNSVIQASLEDILKQLQTLNARMNNLDEKVNNLDEKVKELQVRKLNRLHLSLFNKRKGVRQGGKT